MIFEVPSNSDNPMILCAGTAMEREELIRGKDPLTYGSQDPPLDKPGIPLFPSLYPGVEPSAPPLDLVDTGLGADGSGAGQEHFVLFPQKSTVYQAEESILYISEDEARDAFVQFAASKCCYRSAPAEGMMIQSLVVLNTYRYQLQTFTESRSVLPATEPYRGGFVDSPEMGMTPGPWDIAVEPPPQFTDCEMHLPVPHTYRVQGCPSCNATGHTPCSTCGGCGTRTCGYCAGTGRTTDDFGFYTTCFVCHGSGRIRCFLCHGEGRVSCARCDTKGLLLCHLELTITWKNNVAEYVVDKNQEVPLSCFQEVTGKQLFSDEGLLVTARNLPQFLMRGAESCLAQHQVQVSEETRILRQKHTIELIPLTKVGYEWKGKAYSFWVFGNEKQVYTMDYPGKCCCAIL